MEEKTERVNSRHLRRGSKRTADSKFQNNFGELFIPRPDHSKSNSWKNWKSRDEIGSSGDSKCEFKLINNSNEVLMFSWVSHSGKLIHFYPINDGSIIDGSVSNSHTEFTMAGHLFVCYKASKPMPTKLEHISFDNLVFCYRPLRIKNLHIINLQRRADISYIEVQLRCDPILPIEIIDTSSKPYLTKIISGFTVNYEDGVFENNSNLLPILTRDLETLCELFPEPIHRCLQQGTPLWVNETLTFGPTLNPIVGTSMCFHPGKDWLQKMGLNPLKAGGIEMYCASKYLESRELWGTGGLLLHEYIHATHFKLCPDGYDNLLVIQTFDLAMERRLYDRVFVHGPQGFERDGITKRRVKHYACSNCMEFLAELSVAFFWTKDTETEFNKWFPHNRYQLCDHDPDTTRGLESIWDMITQTCLDHLQISPFVLDGDLVLGEEKSILHREAGEKKN